MQASLAQAGAQATLPFRGWRCARPARPPGSVSCTAAVSRNTAKRGHRVAVAAEGGAAAAASAAAPAASAAASAGKADGTLTERMFKQMERNAAAGDQALGAGGTTSYEALRRADAGWQALRTRKLWGPRPECVRLAREKLGAAPQYDAVVCGGTLGIFLACALQLRGLRVAVVERGPLLGRAQEWNISREELAELVEQGVLTHEEAEASVSVEFNPVRIGFHGEPPRGNTEVWTRDVLNLGVSPARLIEAARRRFEGAGGRVLERTGLQGVWVHRDGVCLQLGGGGGGGGSCGQPEQQQLTARLLLDCMGHASPIVQQIRWGRKPDGVCLVVGSCARGFDPAANTTGDVIWTCSDSQPPAPGLGSSGGGGGGGEDGWSSDVHNAQLYWEAFPAGSGPGDRTSYMFTYLDAEPNRPSLEALLETYWREMPRYQGISLEDLQVQRILFGAFPTYRGSPLRPAFPRVLQIGDASGIQSPLSFGGFGALTRHLDRLTGAIGEALEADCLSISDLALINAYNPGLSGAWMLQRAMSVDAHATSYNRAFINALLSENFKAMEQLGEPVLKPFLQDVIQLGPLVRALSKQMVQDPLMVPQILMRVGPVAMADWLLHLGGLAAYSFLHWDVQKYKPLIEKLPPRPRYMMRRMAEAWEFGAGKDYKL